MKAKFVGYHKFQIVENDWHQIPLGEVKIRKDCLPLGIRWVLACDYILENGSSGRVVQFRVVSDEEYKQFLASSQYKSMKAKEDKARSSNKGR